MAAIRSGSVTSAVRTWQSTIMRRAATVSNMRFDPGSASQRCAAGSVKTQVRHRYFAAATGADQGTLTLPGLALPHWGRSSIEQVLRAAALPVLAMATWRSGYATVCKTVYPGSIPGVASNLRKRSKGRRAGSHWLRLAAHAGTISARMGVEDASCFQGGMGFV